MIKAAEHSANSSTSSTDTELSRMLLKTKKEKYNEKKKAPYLLPAERVSSHAPCTRGTSRQGVDGLDLTSGPVTSKAPPDLASPTHIALSAPDSSHRVPSSTLWTKAHGESPCAPAQHQASAWAVLPVDCPPAEAEI